MSVVWLGLQQCNYKIYRFGIEVTFSNRNAALLKKTTTFILLLSYSKEGWLYLLIKLNNLIEFKFNLSYY